MIDRLTDLDRVMLGASVTWPQDIGALAIFEGPPLLDSNGLVRLHPIGQAIKSRLHLVPRFRQIIYQPREGLGGPLWIDAPDFDVAHHLDQCRVPSPGGDREIAEALERLRAEPLDPSQPMWQMTFLTGLTGHRVGLYVRLHHTIADGMAAMTSVASLLDTVPDPPLVAPLPWTAASAPSDEELEVDLARRRRARMDLTLNRLTHPVTTLRSMSKAWPAVGELLVGKAATKTSLDRMVGARRDLALIRTDLEKVKAVAHAHGGSVNDVLLAITAGGLRALFDTRGEPVEDITVRIYVPVSLRSRASGPQQGNLIAQMAVPIHLSESDVLQRLRSISVETRLRKAKPHTSLGVLMHGRWLRWLALALVTRQRVNATTASIAGPATTLYLAGARLLEVFPLLPLIAREPVGIGALSYAGGLYLGVVVDTEAVPDLEVLTQGVHRDLDALLSAQPTSSHLVADVTRAERTP